MPEYVWIIVGIIVVVAEIVFIAWLIRSDFISDAPEWRRAINKRKAKLCMEKLPLYTPACIICGGRGHTEERTGAMVHTTSRRTCGCRSWAQWCTSISDKWIKEGDIQHAAELLAIVERKTT